MNLRKSRFLTALAAAGVLVGCGAAEAGLKIYYIRHAEGGHNVRRDWADVPEKEWPDYVGDSNQFTPLGKTQLAAVAGKLQALEDRFDYIASSPLWRSRNTILPYMKEMGATGEIWPELKELSVSSEYLFDRDLPVITDPILEQGSLLELPDEEADWFSIRAGAVCGFKMPDYSDEKTETAAAKVVYQAAIDRILAEFGGTDKAILLAGHGASGKNLIRMLTGELDYDSIENTGIWMIEQQQDGRFKVRMYNSVPIGVGPVADSGEVTVRFDDVRADLSDAEINGQTASDSDVTITQAADGLDIVYSFSIDDQDLDGVGGSNDSLSWDIRFRGYSGGHVALNGKHSSVTLGSGSQVYSDDKYFGVSDSRYVDADDSVQFSVENVVLKSDGGATVRFNGFDGLYGSDDSYVFGVGDSGLESRVTTDDADFTFTPKAALTLSCPEGKFRVRDLTGSFTVSSSGGAEAGLKIYYIRHAEGGHNVKAAWEAKGIPQSEWPAYVGNPDMFTPKGKLEVGAATEKLKAYQFDLIASSPIWRARNTILPYLELTGNTAEVWPELREGPGMVTILSEDIPDVDEEILNQGTPIVLPENERERFTLRDGATHNYSNYPRDSDENEKVAYMKHASLNAIKVIRKRFGGSDKSILLAGHNSAGVSLLKLLLQSEPENKRGLNNIGLWMVEEQPNGEFELKMYNDEPVGN